MENSFEKKESFVDRISGLDKETEESLLNFFEEQFKKGEKSECDRERPEELDRIVPAISNFMAEFLSRYGVKSVDLMPHNIHLVDSKKLEVFLESKDENIKSSATEFLEKAGGTTNPIYGILIYDRHIDFEEGNELRFIQFLVHEYIHLNEYTFLQNLDLKNIGSRDLFGGIKLRKNEKDYLFDYRRAGFVIYSNKREKYFRNINEAITTELQIRFEREYFDRIPELRGYIKKWDLRAKPFPRLVRKDVATGQSIYDVQPSYPYEEERKKLNNLIDDLYERNRKVYHSREDVFKEFVQAAFSGRMLRIFKLVERTYGKGSFRRLAEESKE